MGIAWFAAVYPASLDDKQWQSNIYNTYIILLFLSLSLFPSLTCLIIWLLTYIGMGFLVIHLFLNSLFQIWFNCRAMEKIKEALSAQGRTYCSKKTGHITNQRKLQSHQRAPLTDHIHSKTKFHFFTICRHETKIPQPY